ncbi:MAG: DUF971 domain-containing protein [Pseudomonadota bacterium]
MADPPQSLTLKRGSRVLVVDFGAERRYELPFELLRVLSPSAEVRGHGPGQETLPVGKEDVSIVRIEPVGHYAVRLVFDDGHNTGLYTWAYLAELGATKAEKWQAYLDRLGAEGYARKPSISDASESSE